MMIQGKAMLAPLGRALLFLAVTCGLFMGCSQKDDGVAYIEGVHYERFSGEPSARPTITEFFWYGCSHCKSFAPLLDTWQSQNPEITVNFQPIIWGEKSELHARLYYLLSQQSNFDELHHQMFDQVMSFAQTDTLQDHQIALIRVLSDAGISAIDSATALTDSQYDDAIAQSLINQQQFGVTSTPTLIVNQQYKVLNKQLKSLEEVLAVAQWLLEQSQVK